MGFPGNAPEREEKQQRRKPYHCGRVRHRYEEAHAKFFFLKGKTHAKCDE